MPEQLPPKLIRNGQIEDNPWRLYQPEPEHSPLPPDETGWMINLSVWKIHASAYSERQHAIGIVIPTDADCHDLVGQDSLDLRMRHDIAFIAIHFPQYGDGRGYSLAWMLREEYGWPGELRAIGDVLIDTVHYLARCGFTSFVPKPGHDAELALQALNAFSNHYQSAYTQKREYA